MAAAMYENTFSMGDLSAIFVTVLHIRVMAGAGYGE